jgi:polyhydroxyalkanoate synthesis regulator phasin
MINELIQRSKEVKEDIEGKIENVSKEIYDTLHLATKEEIEALKKRISELEAKFK